VTTEYKWFVGIDWGGEHHQVCVLDDQRRKLAERSIEHSGQGLAELVAWLKETSTGEPAMAAVAIEVPHGPLVETLLTHGFAVFSINPKQLDRFRDRFTAAGAKDDRRDAFVLAACLMTDRPSFRMLGVESAFVIRLRELSRTSEDLEREHRRICNQLRDLLFRYYPAMLRLSPAADDPWVWSILATAPLPEEAARLKAARIQKILQKHRIRRISAADVCRELQSQPLALTPGTAESIAEHVRFLIPLLQAVHEQRQRASQTQKELLDQAQSDDNVQEKTTVALLLSLPGVGPKVAATLLSEAWRSLAESDHAGLRCYAGIAPVTKQSGKSRLIRMRHGCNNRVREACYHWARVSAQHDVNSRAHYQRLRSAGHSHGRALRGLCDRLLTVLFAMLRAKKAYDPNLRKTLSASKGEAPNSREVSLLDAAHLQVSN
jgi:transposase